MTFKVSEAKKRMGIRKKFMYAPLPSWRYLAGQAQKPADGVPYWEGDNYIFTYSSAVSLRLIALAYRKLSGRGEVDILLPAYFCDETLGALRGRGMNVRLYAVGEDLEPDWAALRRDKGLAVDIFVLCHYFGVAHGASQARNFCDQKGAVLVEDCAHVLYPSHGQGRKGDFVLYSPHKVLPVPDGGIIAVNRGRLGIVDGMAGLLAKKCASPAEKTHSLWRVKKAVQKITHVQKAVGFSEGAYYGDGRARRLGRHAISGYSLMAIKGLGASQLKEMAYARRCSLEAMDFLVHRMEPGAEAVVSGEVPCPYFAAYLVQDAQARESLVRGLGALGIPAMHWPDLPREVSLSDGFAAERAFSEKTIAVPIHQGIRPQDVARCALALGSLPGSPGQGQGGAGGGAGRYVLRRIGRGSAGRRAWEAVMARARMGNIPQDWAYGDAKQQAEGWGLERILVCTQGGEAVGALQMLRKKRAGATVAVRVNRGPVMAAGHDTARDKLEVMRLARAHVPHPIPILYAPDIGFSGENLALMAQYGWRQWGGHGFCSGVLDLGKGEDALRRGLDSKWRNQLKSAEKKGLKAEAGTGRFSEMLDIYEGSQEEKGFEGIPRGILENLMGQAVSPLRPVCAVDGQGGMVAFDIFYVSGNFGLYLVGWNSEQGRRAYANNLLLFHAALSLREEGLRWMDLGGIDYIQAEENALFKDGMRPVHYQLLGEFVQF